MNDFSKISDGDKEMLRELTNTLWWADANGTDKPFTEKQVCKRFNISSRTLGAIKANIGRKEMKR